MAAKFGTSGLRGLVTELGPDVVAAYVRAFAQVCDLGRGVYVGRDLRDSSPDLAAVVIETLAGVGVNVWDCGAIATPALALAADQGQGAAIMVTGSHIPADRNGLKFYTPAGEITKADEQAILAALGAESVARGRGQVALHDARPAYLDRYLRAYGPAALAGRRVGIWAQTAVGRDLLADILRALGAQVLEYDRRDQFLPVDTEALSPATLSDLARAGRDLGGVAMVSTDGDGDRPLMVDEQGQLVAGDILGQITARSLGAEVVVTPLTSNSGAEISGAFARVLRTKVGSPFVIAAMAEAGGKVAGYEANGGFLLGFTAQGPAGPLPALMTRDSTLPLIATLAQGSVADRVAREPARAVRTACLSTRSSAENLALIADLAKGEGAFTALSQALGEDVATRDLRDGLRLTLASGRVAHLRASGNAPDLRLYVEAEDGPAANRLLDRLTGHVAV